MLEVQNGKTEEIQVEKEMVENHQHDGKAARHGGFRREKLSYTNHT